MIIKIVNKDRKKSSIYDGEMRHLTIEEYYGIPGKLGDVDEGDGETKIVRIIDAYEKPLGMAMHEPMSSWFMSMDIQDEQEALLEYPKEIKAALVRVMYFDDKSKHINILDCYKGQLYIMNDSGNTIEKY